MQLDIGPEPIINDEINDVNQSTWTLIKTHYRNEFFALLAITLGLFGVILWAGYHNPNMFQFLFVVLIIPFALVAYVRGKVQTAFMQQFAKANGYNFIGNGVLEDKIGYMFSLGHSRSVSNEVTGTYQNCPIDLFDYKYTTGQGKSSQTHYKTVFIIDFKTLVPHILLKEHEFMDFGFGAKVKLEGDFSDKFDLFVQKGFEMEALEIYTPDLMSKIENEWKYELEFTQTKLYIYSNGTISKRVDLQNFYDAAKFLATKLDPLVEKMKSDVASMMAEGVGTK